MADGTRSVPAIFHAATFLHNTPPFPPVQPFPGTEQDTMKEPGSPRKVRLGVVRNPSLRNPFQETPACYTLVSTNTSGN